MLEARKAFDKSNLLPMLTLLWFLMIAGSKAVRFAADKTLRDGIRLPEREWSHFELDDVCSGDPEGVVTVKANVPEKLFRRNSSVSVFLANDELRILKIDFQDPTKVIFYKTPYMAEKTIEKSNFTTWTSSGKFVTAEGRFPRTWIPQNCSKMSAALEFPDGDIYTTYGIKNHRISIDDTMVLEEYRKFKC